jgi:hypothetical protein
MSASASADVAATGGEGRSPRRARLARAAAAAIEPRPGDRIIVAAPRLSRELVAASTAVALIPPGFEGAEAVGAMGARVRRRTADLPDPGVG